MVHVMERTRRINIETSLFPLFNISFGLLARESVDTSQTDQPPKQRAMRNSGK